MSKTPVDEVWDRDVEIWNAGAQRGLLEGVAVTSSYLACEKFLVDLTKLLGIVTAHWNSVTSSLIWDEREAIKEFNVPIKEYVKFSFEDKEILLKRFRQNERMRMSEKYGLQDLTHNVGDKVVRTCKSNKDRYWTTYFYNAFGQPAPQFHTPLKLWGYGNESNTAIANHKSCLAWLEGQGLSQ